MIIFKIIKFKYFNLLKMLETLTGVDNEYAVFLLTFFSVMIAPYFSYWYIYDFLSKYYNHAKAQAYSLLLSILIMWIIIIICILHYFTEDFKKVFCNKKKNNLDSINSLEAEKMKKDKKNK